MQPADLDHIRFVNDLAFQSAAKGFDPFASILVKDSSIQAQLSDKCIEYSDPTAHAELALISEYCRKNKLISLENYTMYCNTEPCVMCSGAIHWAKLARVVFSVSQKTLQTISGGKRKPSCRKLINIGGRTIIIDGPLLEEEGMEVFRKFPFSSKKVKHQDYWENRSS